MSNTETIYYNVNDWMTGMMALWNTSAVDAVNEGPTHTVVTPFSAFMAGIWSHTTHL